MLYVVDLESANCKNLPVLVGKVLMFPLCYLQVRRDFSELVSTKANGMDPFPWPLNTLDTTNLNMVFVCLTSVDSYLDE